MLNLVRCPPNTHACPVCLGMPGVLPVLNKKVVEYALRMALATTAAFRRKAGLPEKTIFIRTFPKAIRFPSTNSRLPKTDMLILN